MLEEFAPEIAPAIKGALDRESITLEIIKRDSELSYLQRKMSKKIKVGLKKLLSI